LAPRSRSTANAANSAPPTTKGAKFKPIGSGAPAERFERPAPSPRRLGRESKAEMRLLPHADSRCEHQRHFQQQQRDGLRPRCRRIEDIPCHDLPDLDRGQRDERAAGDRECGASE
jgi:hypothetical protein